MTRLVQIVFSHGRFLSRFTFENRASTDCPFGIFLALSSAVSRPEQRRFSIRLYDDKGLLVPSPGYRRNHVFEGARVAYVDLSRSTVEPLFALQPAAGFVSYFAMVTMLIE